MSIHWLFLYFFQNYYSVYTLVLGTNIHIDFRKLVWINTSSSSFTQSCPEIFLNANFWTLNLTHSATFLNRLVLGTHYLQNSFNKNFSTHPSIFTLVSHNHPAACVYTKIQQQNVYIFTGVMTVMCTWVCLESSTTARSLNHLQLNAYFSSKIFPLLPAPPPRPGGEDLH